ncbi:hypothetical protein M9Y10_014466 [Tritrichomonas musculus]|uniref:Uncharacterized protein n=1 Tax=Tritrichomonas musculus TaxID=1915356 RepID=A0ABR2KZL3_9EUKA
MKVINQIQKETKTFNSIVEFEAYYQKHKDEMEKQTTQYLNKVYKIITPDNIEYRITKKNCAKNNGKLIGGEICLKKVQQTQQEDQHLFEIALESVKVDIENMKTKIEEIKQTVNSVVKFINEMNQT